MEVYLNQLYLLAKPNKYTKWYVTIIAQAKKRANTRKDTKEILGYIEGHHILPRSFKRGGQKDHNNIVFLTLREHYVAHRLLTKMFECPILSHKMRCACVRIILGYNGSRELAAKSHPKRGPLPQHVKDKISATRKSLNLSSWAKGKSHLKGIPKSQAMKEKLSKAKQGNKSKASMWSVTDLVTNETFMIFNLKEYCASNEWDYDRVWQATRYKSKTFRSRWKVEKIEP